MATNSSKIITSSLIHASNGTEKEKILKKPQLKLILYEREASPFCLEIYNIVECIKNRFVALEKRQKDLADLKEEKSGDLDEDKLTDFTAESNKNPYKYYKRMFLDLMNSLNDLGLFTLAATVNKFKMTDLDNDNDVDRLKDVNTEEFTRLIDSLCDYFQDIVGNHMLALNETNFEHLITTKVKCLINVLFKMNLNSKHFHAIIFVEKRETAFLLDHLLKKLASFSIFDEKFRFIKSDYIVGHENDDRNPKMTMKNQTLILDKFRKRDINVLIGTNIIEEGVDITACNTVLRFDVPKDFRSYIQSKGRARALNSEYYILVEKNDYYTKFSNELKQFLDIENFIEKNMKNKLKRMKTANSLYNMSSMLNESTFDEDVDEVDDDDEDEDDDFFKLNQMDLSRLLPPYRKGQSQVNCVMAISLVQRYCTMMMEDSGITLYPKWIIKEIKNQMTPQFYCVLRLPPTSIIHEDVKSDIMQRKKLAKMSAALKMIELLDMAGELDDQLIPVGKSSKTSIIQKESWVKKHLDYDIENEDEVHKSNGFKHKIGTSKTRRPYEFQINNELANNHHPTADQRYHLYLIDIDQDDCSKQDYVNYSCKHVNMGYLCSKKIENIPEMIFRKPRLKLSVKISETNNNDEVRLTCDQYQNLVDFQELLYNKIFNLNFDLDFTSSQYGGFIVLLDDRFNIDFSRANPIGFKQNHLAYLANLTNRGIYLLKELQTDLTPQSPFPRNEYKTYMEYHLIKNGLETKDLQHPLVQVQRLNRNLNFVSNEIKRDVHDTSYRIHFIFEHLVCLAVDYDEFNKLRMMPSILYRLNGLLNARWLKLSIEASGDWLNYANEDNQRATWTSSIKYNNIEQYENDDQMYDMNAEDCESARDDDKTTDLVDDFDISETPIADADEDLGTTSSDCDDYDDDADPPDNRLHQSSLMVPFFSIAEDDANQVLPNVFEILQCLTLRHVNDSFDLERYEVLGDCFLKLSVSHYIYTRLNKTNEGNLTFLKSQRVSNRYLYKLACRKDLHRFVNACAFNAKTNWLAPNHKANIAHVISDKSLADVVEALIGLYLSKCGTIGARKLMNWLEFTISSDYGLVDFNESYEMPSPLVREIANPEERLELEGILKRRYEAFQHRIDYNFANLFYLLQAFTHPSYTSNRYTCSYQRLEFLGDAVLDLLVTQYLFCINKEYSPGEITILRQALVNNKFFAYLCVENGFEKYLKYESYEIYKQINGFLDNKKLYSPKTAYCSTIQDFEDDGITLDDYDSPKVLADLFESVAGAIYLDSGCSLNTVWTVYYKFFAPYFDVFIENPPVSPIAALNKLKPNCKFTCRKFVDKNETEVQIVNGDDIFTARATTKNKARIKACKKALVKYCLDKDALFF